MSGRVLTGSEVMGGHLLCVRDMGKSRAAPEGWSKQRGKAPPRQSGQAVVQRRLAGSWSEGRAKCCQPARRELLSGCLPSSTGTSGEPGAWSLGSALRSSPFLRHLRAANAEPFTWGRGIKTERGRRALAFLLGSLFGHFHY